MTLTLPTLSLAMERAVERGWSRDGLAWFLRDKARTLGGMADHRTGWFKNWRWEDADEGLKNQILARLDAGEWDHLKDVCSAPDVPAKDKDKDKASERNQTMGLNCDEVYAGDNLNAAVLKGLGGSKTLAIEDVSAKTFEKDGGGEEKKLVLHFQGEDKTFSLNVGNKNAMRDAYGPDTDAWLGKTIRLSLIRTTFKGKPCDGVELSIPSVQVSAPAPAPSPSANIPMGDAAEKVLAQKIKDCAEEVGDGCNLDALRSFLVQCFPDAEAVIAGAPATWPRRVGPEITNWLKSQASPFG